MKVKSQKVKSLVTRYWLLVTIILLSFLFLIFNGSNDIAVQQKDNAKLNTAGGKEYLGANVNMVDNDTLTENGLDPAGQIFLEKSASGRTKNKEEAKTIIRYVNQANDAIPLSSDALRFALAELILGDYEPLKDAVLRLEEGKLALEEIEPPGDALTFHKMSIKLLEEYKKVLDAPLAIPRDQFDPAKMNGDFEKLALLVGLAKRELQLLQEMYGVSLFPKSILFYDEAIGIK